VAVTEFLDVTMIIHNGQFAECEVLENFRGLCDPRTKTRTYKLVLEDPRGQELSLRNTTLHETATKKPEGLDRPIVFTTAAFLVAFKS